MDLVLPLLLDSFPFRAAARGTLSIFTRTLLPTFGLMMMVRSTMSHTSVDLVDDPNFLTGYMPIVAAASGASVGPCASMVAMPFAEHCTFQLCEALLELTEARLGFI